MNETYGAHVPLNDFRYWKNCKSLQVFIKSPRSYKTKSITSEQATVFRNHIGTKFFCIHSAYLLNFAKSPEECLKEQVCLVNDFSLLNQILPNDYSHRTGCVIHMGKNVPRLGLSEIGAIKNMAENVRQVAFRARGYDVIIETSAGQGTEICHRLEDFKILRNLLTGIRNVSFCIDTAHVHGAGYDLRTVEKIQIFLTIVEDNLGWDNVSVVHLNDSKVPLGSRKDRHELPGHGYIWGGTGGYDALMFFIRFCQSRNIPMIRE